MPCKNHPPVLDGLVRCTRCLGAFCSSCVVELSGSFYCANCKVAKVRDVQSGFGFGPLDLAPIGKRFAAIFIDGAMFFVGTMAFMVLRIGLGAPQSASGPDLLFLAFIFGTIFVRLVYEGLMLQSRGQTIGKIVMRIKVVTPEGNDISPGQAWGRAAIRLLLSSCLAIVNYIPAFVSPERTCLHDRAAGTRVVNWNR